MSEVFDRDRIHRKLTELSAFWRQRIDGWRVDGTESGTEKRHAQQLWSDLMGCFDIASERIDVFERNADRASTGGRGYIDFFWSGVVIGEAKSLDVPLERAYDQVLDYLNGGSVGTHEWPRFILVTNFEHFRLDRLGDDTESWTVEFSIDEITDYLEQLLFFAGVESLTKREQENASIEAARLMANLFNTLVGEEADEAVGEEAPTDPEEEDDTTELASILMTRLLFLMYGDDAGLWEQDLFYRWVESVNSKNIGPALDGLFEILNTDYPTRRRKYRNNLPELEARFPYVNGGIFDGTAQVGYSVPPEFKEALLDASRFRWTSISPAIFGSMFQLVKSKEARRGDGEHYTSETNILKTLGPLFLDEYRDRADRLIANKSTSVADLRRFQEELASNIYIDPACGAGNFLNVAYAKLREIETDIIVERRKRSGTGTGSLDVTFDQLLTIDKFYGIEINWWPAKIAETAMFLVDHQANRHLAAQIGEAPDRLPIEITATIVHGDALETNWNEVVPNAIGQTFVFGNPPFLGHDSRTKEQAAKLRAVWNRKDISRLDYVTAWHIKTLDLLADRDGEWAFVTTNSITQGDQVPRLFGAIFSCGWKIKFAHRTFAWDSEAPGKAVVHCVIVGFTREKNVTPRLWDYANVKAEAQEIPVRIGVNAYLVDGPNVLVTSRSTPLNPQLPPVAFGNVPRDGGGLIINSTEYSQFMTDPVAAKYVRPYIGARELLHAKERWCLWLENLDPADVEKSPLLKERINQVRDFRINSSSTAAQEAAMTPHLFWWNSHPHEDYLCIPRVVSENRPFFTAARLSASVIASDATFVAPDPDGLLFGVVSSSMFISWQRAVGGRLKSDLRFSGTLSWNNFPLPEISPEQKESIIAAGAEIAEARARHPDRSLAQQYSPLAMDPGLLKVHQRLDGLVDRAFGASRRLSNERQRLELLFNSYQTLTCDD